MSKDNVGNDNGSTTLGNLMSNISDSQLQNSQ